MSIERSRGPERDAPPAAASGDSGDKPKGGLEYDLSKESFGSGGGGGGRGGSEAAQPYDLSKERFTPDPALRDAARQEQSHREP